MQPVTSRLALSTTEIAHHCSVTLRTVASWIEFGMLRSYKRPGRADDQVRVEDFLDFVSEQELPVPDEFSKPRRRRVLIVDNEPRVARRIRRVLLRGSFEPRIASDGFHAGSLLPSFSPGIVTLDLQMPGICETDLLSYIQETAGCEQVKVLVLSAMGPGDVARAFKRGAHAAIPKPFQDGELLDQVERLADSRRARTRTRPATLVN